MEKHWCEHKHTRKKDRTVYAHSDLKMTSSHSPLLKTSTQRTQNKTMVEARRLSESQCFTLLQACSCPGSGLQASWRLQSYLDREKGWVDVTGRNQSVLTTSTRWPFLMHNIWTAITLQGQIFQLIDLSKL